MNAQNITIVVDSREKKPYAFDPEKFQTITTKLDTGDYSAVNFESRITVERKSKADLINTITRNRKRFFAEVKRMKNFDHACVVVECSLSDILSGHYEGGILPASLVGFIISIIVNYEIPIFFCGDRIGARIFTEKFIKSSVKNLNSLS